jgi:CheY-like chemotaxis protein
VIADLKRIVLAEDNANDVELTLTALRENHVANEVTVVRDGAEALDCLYRRSAHDATFYFSLPTNGGTARDR